MCHPRLAIAFGLAASVALLVAGRGSAVAPEIKDEAKFFSADAMQKANKQIREIARQFDRDLLIETVAAIPGEQSERVKKMSPEDRRKFFRNWAADRAEARVVHGIYILACKDPPHLEVFITPRARSAFDATARQNLAELLLRNFRAKKYDEALSSAVGFVSERFAATLSEKR